MELLRTIVDPIRNQSIKGDRMELLRKTSLKLEHWYLSTI